MTTGVTTTTTTAALTTKLSPARIVAGLAAAAGTAIAADSFIAVLARALGAPAEFRPLQFATYAGLTVAGVAAGAVGWVTIRRRFDRPAALLRWLIPTVIVLSWIPDAVLLVADVLPGTTVQGVGALMLMHVAVAAAAVPAYRAAFPLADRR
jgi:Family of unknown function (DUF6069)